METNCIIVIPDIIIHIANIYKCVVIDPAIRPVADKSANIITVLRWPIRSLSAPASGPDK